jgi:hypothetical protein
MSIVQVQAWKCDRPSCGHVWLAEEKPKACARCKSRGWDRSPAVAQVMPAQVERKAPAIPRVVAQASDVQPVIRQALARGGHDPTTCRAYRCGMCAALGHKDPRRGL